MLHIKIQGLALQASQSVQCNNAAEQYKDVVFEYEDYQLAVWQGLSLQHLALCRGLGFYVSNLDCTICQPLRQSTAGTLAKL